MATAADIIDASRATNPAERLALFRQASERATFAQQEVVEQLSQQAIALARDPNVSPEVREQFLSYAEEQLLALAEFKPGDARIHVFIGSFYRATNQLDKAAEQMAIARALSPQKQSIMYQQGLIAITQERYEEAVDFLRTAYESETSNVVAREYYIASLMYVGDVETAQSLLETPEITSQIAASDFVATAANQAGEYGFLAQLFEARVASNPEEAQTWATLAFVYYQDGRTEDALRVLGEAADSVPSFSETATCFANNIEQGIDPQTGC
jgi:tetratricopeptide (TPR) repeat protein